MADWETTNLSASPVKNSEMAAKWMQLEHRASLSRADDLLPEYVGSGGFAYLLCRSRRAFKLATLAMLVSIWHIAGFAHRNNMNPKISGTSPMQIWPAIDLRGGKCVRLRQGDYAQETVFGDDPAAMARQWVEQGADRLHLVDLDGARDGTLANRDAIASILAAVDVPCQLGGGVREQSNIETLLELGLSRLVIGTKAIKEPQWFRDMCERFPHKLALGIDARGGLVATDGWLETSSQSATDLVASYADLPIAAVIYTDIARDGMLSGPNVEAMQQMKQATAFPVLASGGVSCAADVSHLATAGLDGVIVGRALYDGAVTMASILEAAKAT